MKRKTKRQAERAAKAKSRKRAGHALGLELYDLQERRMQLTKDEKAKRDEAAALLKLRGIDHYHVDGVELWVEPGPSKVKVRKDSGGDDGEDEAEEGAA